ncbi:hypothetical protein MCOR08_000523 [Pyricularia oryzae]|uniref:Uncharacterized protein n=1 Tax=Pyricularia oryzae TaxID=318829 RepID=A0A4P7NTP9_PYROR|nr:hypothetical protein MCOR04_004134 [Pyricularia oryzae]KAI6642622.1 hypothetical protein MCOR08_000523 [Pyricularia oryzae]QBZ65256.1 hypothetical protein PoMZ_06963 [Pyricularia oryzae]
MSLTDLETKMLKTAQQQIELQKRDVTRLEQTIERKRTRAEAYRLKTAQALETLTETKESLCGFDSVIAKFEGMETSLSAHRQRAEAKTQLFDQARAPSLAAEVTSLEHLESATQQHRQVASSLARARAQRCALGRRVQAAEEEYDYVVHDERVCAEVIRGFEEALRESRDKYQALLVVADADNLAGYESETDKIRRDGDATVVSVASHIYELVTCTEPIAPMHHLWMPC